MLLVSICNTGVPSGNVFVLVDTARNVSRVLDLKGQGVDSGLGLVQDDRYVYAACAARRSSFLAIFAKPHLELIRFELLPNVIDVHSICLFEGKLITVSTGTDEVVAFDPAASSLAGDVLWHPSLTRDDNNHLNAVAAASGHLLCSGFGQKAGERWSSARDGFVFDLSLGRNVASGIFHPHSVLEHNGTVYLCESSFSLLRTLATPQITLGGYVRGLVFNGDTSCFVGSSVGRSDSAAPQEVANPADPGDSVGRCCVYEVDLTGRAETATRPSLDLSAYGNEIYDLLWSD